MSDFRNGPQGYDLGGQLALLSESISYLILSRLLARVNTLYALKGASGHLLLMNNSKHNFIYRHFLNNSVFPEYLHAFL